MKFKLEGLWANPTIRMIEPNTPENIQGIAGYDISKDDVFSTLGAAKKAAKAQIRSAKMSSDERTYANWTIDNISTDELIAELFDSLEYAQDESTKNEIMVTKVNDAIKFPSIDPLNLLQAVKDALNLTDADAPIIKKA